MSHGWAVTQLMSQTAEKADTTALFSPTAGKVFGAQEVLSKYLVMVKGQNADISINIKSLIRKRISLSLYFMDLQ